MQLVFIANRCPFGNEKAVHFTYKIRISVYGVNARPFVSLT